MTQKSITFYFKNNATSSANLNDTVNNNNSKSDYENKQHLQYIKPSTADNKQFSAEHTKTEYELNVGEDTIPESICHLYDTDDSGNHESCKKTFSIIHKSLEYNGDFEYDPSKHNYHPISDAFWRKGQHTPYLALTRTFQLIEEIRGRLRMIDILSNFFRSVIILNPTDLLACIYLCLNKLAPASEGLELGIAESSLIKAISNCTGKSILSIKMQVDSIGDLGIVAERARETQRLMYEPAPLTVCRVFKILKEVANLSGPSAMTKKVEKIQGIFVACRQSESRFFIRSLLGKLRIGIAEQSLIQALAKAITNTPPNQPNFPPKIICAENNSSELQFKNIFEENYLILKTTYCQCPLYDKLIPLLLENGILNLSQSCPMEPGVPIKPMLAHPSKGVDEVLARFQGMRFTCEWKYDGERAQIHYNKNGTVSIFSRNQENNTSKYPDIISRIEAVKNKEVSSFIMDAEIVAWDIESKQIRPFQVLSTRKRKNADKAEIKIQVCVYMFDLLYINGNSLVSESLLHRRQFLKSYFKEIEGQWHFATACDTSDIDEVQQFLEASIKGNCEGLMIKTLEKDASYEIAKRSHRWLKLKKDYLSGVGDSLDLVVMGGYKGKGKRAGLYGGFLLSCYDPLNEEYQCICKIGTGFSDEDLVKFSENLKDFIISVSKSYYKYHSSLEADVWFEPVKVWEIKCADLSLSPIHKAGIGIIDAEKGISLRFPRFIRTREDKNSEDATSSQQVVDMYLSQDQIKNQHMGKIQNELKNVFY